MADAGPDQTVATGALVQLDGSGSTDADLDPITSYAWTLSAKPTGSLAALNDSTLVNPTLTADAIGVYVLDLVVGDGTVTSAPDFVVITAQAMSNGAPVLDPVGNRTVNLGTTLAMAIPMIFASSTQSYVVRIPMISKPKLLMFVRKTVSFLMNSSGRKM